MYIYSISLLSTSLIIFSIILSLIGNNNINISNNVISKYQIDKLVFNLDDKHDMYVNNKKINHKFNKSIGKFKRINYSISTKQDNIENTYTYNNAIEFYNIKENGKINKIIKIINYKENLNITFMNNNNITSLLNYNNTHLQIINKINNNYDNISFVFLVCGFIGSVYTILYAINFI